MIQRLDRALARSDGHSPAYSGKQRVSGDRRIFSSKRSFLLRNRMMEVSPNHLLLHIESNSLSDSCIRFWNRKAEANADGLRIQTCSTMEDANLLTYSEVRTHESPLGTGAGFTQPLRHYLAHLDSTDAFQIVQCRRKCFSF